MNKLEMVKDFMRAFQQEVPLHPTAPDYKTQCLRHKLIVEELAELQDGFDKQDIKEIVDAIADLLYVVYGTAAACGINNLDEIFAEVHCSNMSKMWTLKELQAIDDKPELQVIKPDVVLIEADLRQFVILNEHGKVVKSPSYSPAKFEVK